MSSGERSSEPLAAQNTASQILASSDPQNGTGRNPPGAPAPKTTAGVLTAGEARLDTLLADVLRGTSTKSSTQSSLDRERTSTPLFTFLNSDQWIAQLQTWFGSELFHRRHDRLWLIAQLQRDIAQIDQLIQSQVNAILHHASFQRLESAWRGLQYLVDQRDGHADSPMAIRVFNATWLELRSDLEGATEFDQSQLFRKVYEDGLGTPGADPFSVLICDYAIHPRPSREHPFDDLYILRGLGQVAAAAFCPLVINASPAMFAVDTFPELRHATNLQSLHEGLDFFAWQRFRESEDARFVTLALPRVLMRVPYRDTYDVGIPYNEEISTVENYLWGGAAFAVGEVLMRSFAQGRWFANIRGAQRGIDGGGLVHGPVVDRFGTEPFGNAVKPMTDLVIGDDFERELSRSGFLPLCACKDMPLAAFYSCATAQKPRAYSTADATANAKLSSLLNYMLCVSRFGHYLKVISRDKIGNCSTPEELERILHDWIIQYVTADTDADQRIRSERPLRAAEIAIRALPGKPGEYGCIIHIAPHHELDDIQASVRLDTRLIQPVRT